MKYHFRTIFVLEITYPLENDLNFKKSESPWRQGPGYRVAVAKICIPMVEVVFFFYINFELVKFSISMCSRCRHQNIIFLQRNGALNCHLYRVIIRIDRPPLSCKIHFSLQVTTRFKSGICFVLWNNELAISIRSSFCALFNSRGIYFSSFLIFLVCDEQWLTFNWDAISLVCYGFLSIIFLTTPLLTVFFSLIFNWKITTWILRINVYIHHSSFKFFLYF